MSYKRPTRVQQSVHVLDVGFGLGIGLKALIDVLKNYDPQGLNHSYTSIELDEDLFLWSIKETFPDYQFNKKDNTYICNTLTCSLLFT